MAKPFGYVDKSDRTIRSYKDSQYWDFRIEYASFTLSDFNSMLQNMGLFEYRTFFELKLENRSHQSTGWMTYDAVRLMLIDSPYQNLLYVHFKFDPAVLYQIDGKVFNYSQDDPSVDTLYNTTKYAWDNKEIKESDALNIRTDKFTFSNDAQKCKVGFGYKPASLLYTYIDGAFKRDPRGNWSFVRPLYDRMAYRIWYEPSTRTVTINIKKWEIEGNLVDGYNTISSDWASTYRDSTNVGSYTFSDSTKDPIICIAVCRPAPNKDNMSDDHYTRLTLSTMASKTFYFECGQTDYYYIDCNTIPSSGIVIECSKINTRNAEIPLVINPRDPSSYKVQYSATKSWFSNAEILTFSSEPLTSIGSDKNGTLYTVTDSFTKDSDWQWDKRLSWGPTNNGIDEGFKTLDKDGHMMPDLDLSTRYHYDIPHFYHFYHTYVSPIRVNSSVAIQNVELNTQIYMVYNKGSHREALLHIYAPTYSRNFENLPGLGDFPFYADNNDSSGWKHYVIKEVEDASFSKVAKLYDIDRHSLYLLPQYEYVSGGSYQLTNGLTLPITSLFKWNTDSIKTVADSRTYYLSKDNISGLSEWQDLQNAWGFSVPYMEDFCWYLQSTIVPDEGVTSHIDYTIKNFWYIPEQWTGLSSKRSLANTIHPRYEVGTQPTSIAYKRKSTLNANTGNYVACGKYFISWWKNTGSIPVSSSSNCDIIDNALTPYMWRTHFPLTKLPSNYTIENPAEQFLYNSQKYAWEQLIKSYNYIYPESSQAPGAIAIYAVTW